MSLDRTIVKAGASGLASAKEWNAFARHVNALWNTKAGPGLKLTKGEPWLLEYEAGDEPITSWFNDTCIRVFVWRDDAWDYGSDNPPLAFFVSGAFTTLNGRQTLRLAKVVKGSSGASARATSFCNRVDFTSSTAFFTKNKTDTAKLFVGSQAVNSYAGGPNVNAHLLDWRTGVQDSNWTGVNCTFPSTAMVGIASVEDRLLIHDYYTVRSVDLSGTVQNSRVSSGMNMHGIVNDGVFGYLSCAWGGTYGGTLNPQGLRKIDKTGAQNSAYSTNAGVGSACGCFFGALPNLVLWNAGDTNAYTSASLQYGSALTWNGGAFGFAGYDGGILKVSSTGTLQGTPLGILPGAADRATVFCKSPAGELWFGADVYELKTGAQTFTTSPYQLYKYNEATDTVTYFSGFDGAVIDCQWFSTVEGVQQFIVVGAFTTYNGEPAERIVFIDQDGNRLPDLIWP